MGRDWGFGEKLPRSSDTIQLPRLMTKFIILGSFRYHRYQLMGTAGRIRTTVARDTHMEWHGVAWSGMELLGDCDSPDPLDEPG